MRERYIDIVKGLSILCITLLHYEDGIFPACINVFIGSFMITAFYVTSGWLTAMRPTSYSFKELVKKRWRQLGVPYLWWTGIILVFDLILYAFHYYDLSFIGREVYKTIMLRGIGTLWFLPALFGGELIWYGLRKQQKGWLIAVALVLTIGYQYGYGAVFGGKTETIYRIIDAPFRTISNMLGAWVGIAFGYYAYKMLNKNLLRMSNKTVLAMSGLFFCTFAFVTANYLPASLGLFWNYLAPLFGPLGFLLLVKACQQSSLLDYFNYWGLNSLNLMVTHYSITLVLCTIIVEKGFAIPFYGWVTLLCFVISMLLQYLIVAPIDKYAKFTLGK